MAFIRPFRAFRYNEEVISDINRKFSPLFDVVSREEIERLYTIPNNSIHLSVPHSLDEAVHKLEEWHANNVLIQDPLPGIYIYYQHFSLYGEKKEYIRKGFVAMVRMNEDENGEGGDVILHEDTISSSVAERSRVLEATMLNVAPTHGLYNDPDHQLEDLMDTYMEQPVYEYMDYQGVINKLAIVQHKADLERFLKVIQDKKIYLADGHHRYASSLALKHKVRKEGEDHMSDYHLSYLTNLASDDLRILPIHRVLRTPGQPQIAHPRALLRRFDEFFEARDVSRSKLPLYEEIRQGSYSFGMAVDGKQYLLVLKDHLDPVKDNPLPLPEEVKQLPYTVLHYFVFDRIFGIPYAEQAKTDRIEYVKDFSSAVRRSIDTNEAVAFITPGLSMEDMMGVCDAGAIMPQKSTYFYPKVVCGLLFASIHDKHNDSPFDSGFQFPPASGAAEGT